LGLSAPKPRIGIIAAAWDDDLTGYIRPGSDFQIPQIE
jgi:hypothetical protein